VVYCHSNNGNRLETRNLVNQLLSKNIELICFDFSGSGQSQGEYVTLGVNEADDLNDVIEFSWTEFKIDRFVLWGRSMGAVTIIKYLNIYHPNQ